MYLPTRREIRAACAEIQATWTPEDFYLRREGWPTETALTDVELDERPVEAPDRFRAPAATPAAIPAPAPTPAPISAPAPLVSSSIPHRPPSAIRRRGKRKFLQGDLQVHVEVFFQVGNLLARDRGHTARISLGQDLVASIMENRQIDDRAAVVELLRDTVAGRIEDIAVEAAAADLIERGLEIGPVLRM